MGLVVAVQAVGLVVAVQAGGLGNGVVQKAA